MEKDKKPTINDLRRQKSTSIDSLPSVRYIIRYGELRRLDELIDEYLLKIGFYHRR